MNNMWSKLGLCILILSVSAQLSSQLSDTNMSAANAQVIAMVTALGTSFGMTLFILAGNND